MSACAGFTEHHWPTGGPADVFVRRVLENFLDFFLGDTMLGTMLHVSSRVVVEAPAAPVARTKRVWGDIYERARQGSTDSAFGCDQSNAGRREADRGCA